MSDLPVEGGPLDGQRLPDCGYNIVRVPLPLPWNVRLMHDTTMSLEIIEYERRGKVYRWPGLIGDAQGRYDVTAEAFREPKVRSFLRQKMRRQLEELAPGKEVDRIVWVVALDRVRMTYAVAAVVGGRRVEHAKAIRDDLRTGFRW